VNGSPALRIGRWSITVTYLVAVALAAVFVAGLASTPSLSDAFRPAAIAFVVTFVVSVPVHELGHVVAVKVLGHRVDRVRIGLYSGVAWSASDATVSVRDVLLVSAAGPATNLVVALLALGLIGLTSLSTASLLGVAGAMIAASGLDLIPSVSRHVTEGAVGVRMSDGAAILHAWRQRAG
jgi:Zn-dependent protease